MERERDWCRHVKVNIASTDRQVERERENIASADRQVERERERCVCVFFFNFVSLFFTLGTRQRISKFCVNLCKKNLKRFQFLSIIADPKLLSQRYNINWNLKSTERAKAFWFSEGRAKQCCDSSVVRDE